MKKEKEQYEFILDAGPSIIKVALINYVENVLLKDMKTSCFEARHEDKMFYKVGGLVEVD